MTRLRLAPEWEIETWINTPTPVTLEAQRGRVVVALAFQMLCPGCVQSALPQLQRVRAAFSPDHVQVVGLHTVFEHHEVMTLEALKVFAHEYRLNFPIGVDRPSADGGLPCTMRRYGMQGTPTLMLIDRKGYLRQQTFGHENDLRLGAAIQALLMDGAPTQSSGGTDGSGPLCRAETD